MISTFNRLSQAARHEQRGQSLVFTLAFAAVSGLAILLLFNNSKMANAKTSLQNAADAAALAAATLQARDHNFSAYTNRAMIANQVSVAQFVSLKSYLNDAAGTRKRMDNRITGWWNSGFPKSKSRWDNAKRLPIKEVDSLLGKLAPTSVKGLDALIKALSKAQALHHTGVEAEILFIAEEVAKKNDPAASVNMLKSGFALLFSWPKVRAWAEATRQHPANTKAREADRFADAVLHAESIDGFTGNRGGLFLAGWTPTSVSQFRCPAASRSNTFFQFSHSGGTILSADKKRWLALDATLGVGEATCKWVIPIINVEIGAEHWPLADVNISPPQIGGSGGAVAGRSGGYEANGYKKNASWSYTMARFLPSEGLRRYLSYGPGKTLDSGGGLQDYYRDVADPLNKKPENQTPEKNGGATPITIEVERPIKGMRLANEVLAPSSGEAAMDVRLDDAAPGSKMRTLASAHAYFYRPKADGSEFTRKGWKRADRKTEMANLFNPYWQARLTETPAAERAASAFGPAL